MRKKDGHSSRINDLVLTQTGQLFSCSEDGFICQWDVHSGQLLWKSKRLQDVPRKLCLTSDTTILASGSSTIRLWDLSSKQTIKKITGHSSSLTSMKFSEDDKLLLTSSNERFIYLWDCSLDSTDKKALQGFVCTSGTIQTDITQQLISDGCTCLALLDSNSIELWNFLSVNKTTKPIKAEGKVSSKSNIFCVQFCNQNQIIIAYGTPTKPTFQKLEFSTQTGQIVTEQELSTTSSNILLPSNKDVKQTKKSKKSNESVIGSINMPIPDEEILSYTPQSNEKKGDSELTIQDKLEALGLSIPTKEIPKADSLHTNIIQALNARDNKLMESCLQTNDSTVIKNTVHGLPASQVLPFLNFIIEHFQAAPSRIDLIPWLRSILLYHSSYLVTVPDLAKSLTRLYVTIDSRLAAFPHLLKLSGRLDLLVSQLSNVTEVYDYRSSATIYEEESSGDEEDDIDNKIEQEDDETNNIEANDMMEYDDD